MKHIKTLISASLAALLLASCGGGGGSATSSNAVASNIRVFGDSLADSGVFGFKFTVNRAGAAGAATPIWPELVAANYSKTLCNFYNATSFTSFTAPTLTCNNYAVGGGRINSLANTGGPTSPFSITDQMDKAAGVVGGIFPAGELMLIDGGGNDVADLVTVYLGINPATGAGLAEYQAFITSLVPLATYGATIGTTNGAAALATLYMQALANKQADAINTKLLARGATRVAVLNAPAVTNTPRFKAVLAGVAAQAGAATAAAIEGAAVSWTSAFNTQLNARLGAESRVAIIDFFTEFNKQVATPGQFGLTNVATPVCPVTGTTGGLPDYTFPTCTAAALDASGPTGWRNYGFSDGFHPTPFAHQLLAQLVSRSLIQKGWL